MHKGKFQSSDQKSVSINCPTESDYICTIRPKLITNVIACILNGRYNKNYDWKIHARYPSCYSDSEDNCFG